MDEYDKLSAQDDEQPKAPEVEVLDGLVAEEDEEELLQQRDDDVGEDSMLVLLEAAEYSPRPELQHGPSAEKTLSGLPGGKDQKIATLERKLNQARRINAELHTQLQRFVKNEVFLQVENRVKEKQKQVDELARENRTLKNSERLLAKEIEDLQNSKDNFPSKKKAMQEELRVSKERMKQLKEQCRVADEKGLKLHHQTCCLLAKNKELSDRIRLLEGGAASVSALSPAPSTARVSPGSTLQGTPPDEVQTIISSQEEEITRLLQRIALMKKTHKAEQLKFDRLLKASQAEMDQARVEMESFYQQLFAKERAARNQFLHMKKLKRALHELALTQQTNQRFQPFLANREMRIMNRGGVRQAQTDKNSPPKGPVLNPGRWIHEALHQLGFVMPLALEQSTSQKSFPQAAPVEQGDTLSNSVQGKLVPCPPPSTGSARGLFYTHSPRGVSRSITMREDCSRPVGSFNDSSDEEEHEARSSIEV